MITFFKNYFSAKSRHFQGCLRSRGHQVRGHPCKFMFKDFLLLKCLTVVLKWSNGEELFMPRQNPKNYSKI